MSWCLRSRARWQEAAVIEPGSRLCHPVPRSPGLPASPRVSRRCHVPHALRVRPVSARPAPADPPPRSPCRSRPAAESRACGWSPPSGPWPVPPACSLSEELVGRPQPCRAMSKGLGSTLSLLGPVVVPSSPSTPSMWPVLSPTFYILWVLGTPVLLNTGEGRARPV